MRPDKNVTIGVMVFAMLMIGYGVVKAQDQWWRGSCTTCRMISWIDVPGVSNINTSPTVVSRSQGFYLAGWGFICEQGGPANRVDVWYQKDDGYYTPLLQSVGSLYNELHRPDVQAAYAPYCPNLGANVGWHLYVTNMPPLGTRNIAIIVWRDVYYETHYRTVTIVP